MKIFHVERDKRLSLKQQKAKIRDEYVNVVLAQSDGRTVTVFADGKK